LNCGWDDSIFLDSTAPLLASNSGHLPHDLRQMVNRHVAMSLRKDPATAKGSKKGPMH